MTTLNHTTTTNTILATEAPYVSAQCEARWYGNSLWEFLVPAEQTGGNLSVFQATMPEGFSPPRHIHTREDEVFVVLEGEPGSTSMASGTSPGPARACTCRGACPTPSASRARSPECSAS
jgi:hypothetical protein